MLHQSEKTKIKLLIKGSIYDPNVDKSLALPKRQKHQRKISFYSSFITNFFHFFRWFVHTSVTTVRQAHTSSSVMISWETKKNVDLRFWIKPLMYKWVLSLQFMGSKYLFRVSKEWIQILWCAKCACTLVTEVQRCCNTKQSSTTRFRNANDSMCNLKQSDVALIGH